jgi:hypothetical protein
MNFLIVPFFNRLIMMMRRFMSHSKASFPGAGPLINSQELLPKVIVRRSGLKNFNSSGASKAGKSNPRCHPCPNNNAGCLK